jgi:hypothetical protein
MHNFLKIFKNKVFARTHTVDYSYIIFPLIKVKLVGSQLILGISFFFSGHTSKNYPTTFESYNNVHKTI